MSCPFLSALNVSTIPKQMGRILSMAKRCPVARNMFSTSISSEEKVVTCSDPKQCISKDCPYVEAKIDMKTLKLKKDIQQVPKNCAHHEKFVQSLKTLNESNASFDYQKHFNNLIEAKKQDSTYRVFRKVLRDAGQFPYANEYSSGEQKRVTVWCSNDYLGMSWHPQVQEAAVTAINKYGVGSGGTRNISGNTMLHEELERELADLHNKESALVFTSCYVANEATLHTLGVRLPNVTLYSDAGNHASMIHGIRTSRAPKKIFRHNDPDHLRELLKKGEREAPKVVAFETVHSMSGNICPLGEFLDVCKEFNALSFVDEVHAVGLYGEEGAGVAQERGLMHRIDAITGTLGKAYASIGGYLAGDKALVDMIRSYASGFIFTTSLPPPVLASALASVRLLRSATGKELRDKHQKRVTAVRNELVAAGLPVIDCPSHIIPVHVGDATLCTKLSHDLLSQHQIYVQAINYPTVAKGEERLRIAPTPHHTDEHTAQLVEALTQVWKSNDLDMNTVNVVAA
ncbi:5-aminolevulinate synthase, nonspecific, mitochondrial [Cichlidogyrus casuarinus]|uniref:5-aminolevulinate synthase n=1 Tax=Cichlidogyrus casuarinus TaxID=1844966 RepID=A0ABD2QQX4_9PLAT